MTRHQAEWMGKMAYHPVTGDVEPYRCEYQTAVYDSLERAAKVACLNNCYGSEGFVNVQEWHVDRDREGFERGGWLTVERWLCQDGEPIEKVAP